MKLTSEENRAVKNPKCWDEWKVLSLLGILLNGSGFRGPREVGEVYSLVGLGKLETWRLQNAKALQVSSSYFSDMGLADVACIRGGRSNLFLLKYIDLLDLNVLLLALKNEYSMPLMMRSSQYHLKKLELTWMLCDRDCDKTETG